MSHSRADISAAIKSVIEGVADTGVVLTDQRFAGEDSEIVALIQALHPDGDAKGWLITWQLLTEIEDATLAGCRSLQTLQFKIQNLYPYKRQPVDGVTSSTAFQTAIEAVATALRSNRTLGFTDDLVRHFFLQSAEPFAISAFQGTGKDTLVLHYATFTLNVENTVFSD